jgi:hypothetical protein
MARHFHSYIIYGRLLALAFALAASGCNSTGLQGGGNRKGSDERKDKPKNERQDESGKDLGTDRPVSDEEDELANKPVPVSGAMLTCASVSIPGGDSDFDLFGCVIERDKRKFERDEFRATYTVATLPDRQPVRGAVVEAADEISLWHVFVKVPANDAPSYQVSAVVHWDKDGKDVPETLTAEVSRSGKLQALRFGMTREFHLGNNDYSGSACKPRINTVALFGSLLSIRFRVAADDTRAAFHFTGICGLDHDDVARIRIKRGTAVIKTVSIKTSSPEIVFGFDALTAGDYTLELESLEISETNKDRDDFIIGDITILSNAPITGELPAP